MKHGAGGQQCCDELQPGLNSELVHVVFILVKCQMHLSSVILIQLVFYPLYIFHKS